MTRVRIGVRLPGIWGRLVPNAGVVVIRMSWDDYKNARRGATLINDLRQLYPAIPEIVCEES